MNLQIDTKEIKKTFDIIIMEKKNDYEREIIKQIQKLKKRVEIY